MKELTLSDFHINKKEKRGAYYKVLDFIDSNRCYDGVVAVLYGLRATGKTTIVHQLMVDNSDRFSCIFFEATSKDTMDDIYNALDEAVAGNIYRSLQCYSKYANYNALFKISPTEMSIAIRKLVENYSGVSAINADTRIAQKFDDDMIAQLKSYLIRLGFISATNIQKFIFDRNAGWSNSPVYKEYYLTQPTIKYHHLKNALEFVETSEYYNTLPEKDKKLVTDMLDSKLTEDMAKQIILYEISNALPKNRYLVCKVSFSEKAPSNETGEYDMLIYDKAENSYYAFAIRNTTEPDSEQCRHLLNESFKEIVDSKYGKREKVSVLYNGKPFITPSGVMYLNISDFVKNIARCKDIKAI